MWGQDEHPVAAIDFVGAARVQRVGIEDGGPFVFSSRPEGIFCLGWVTEAWTNGEDRLYRIIERVSVGLLR